MEEKRNGRRLIAGAIIFIIGLSGGFIMACAQLKTTPEPGAVWRGKYPITVTAHRGFSGENPENTLASFRAAIAAGADMVELDVHLTRDNELVVIHDDTLERTTDGKGNVADKTLAELKRLDAGFKFNPRFAGERIPTLTEVLDVTRGRILVNIELKKGKNFPYTMEELADRTLAVVEKAGMTGPGPLLLLRSRGRRSNPGAEPPPPHRRDHPEAVGNPRGGGRRESSTRRSTPRSRTSTRKTSALPVRPGSKSMPGP